MEYGKCVNSIQQSNYLQLSFNQHCSDGIRKILELSEYVSQNHQPSVKYEAISSENNSFPGLLFLLFCGVKVGGKIFRVVKHVP